jgi:hypothetical protein
LVHHAFAELRLHFLEVFGTLVEISIEAYADFLASSSDLLNDDGAAIPLTS